MRALPFIRHRRKLAPGPPGQLLFGNLPAYRRDPLQFYLDAHREYGDVVRFRAGPWHWHLIAHPEDVQYVLRDNYPNYGRSFFNNYLKSLLGQGLLTSEGDLWLRQRRLMQPVFHRKRIVDFATTMTDATAAMLERWEPYACSGQPLDVAAEMMRLTLEIVGRTLFSVDISRETDTVGRALTTAIEHINQRSTRLFPIPESVPTPANRRYYAARETLDKVVHDIIETRRRSDGDADDLLAMLLQARDEETGESMSNQQLRDEVMTIMLAGHETTAVALSWTWYLLSKHPHVAEKLHAELAQVLDGRSPTLDDLPDLTYTKMVIEEVMRLYPPAWIMSRAPLEDDEIRGYHIPAGTSVMLCQYVTHRHPDFWPNPEGFDPERFAPERTASRLQFAHFPFGGGPRQCIGNEFAMLEARLIVAMVAQRYRLDLVPGHPVEPQPMITLRPRDGILMTLHEQTTAS